MFIYLYTVLRSFSTSISGRIASFPYHPFAFFHTHVEMRFDSIEPHKPTHGKQPKVPNTVIPRITFYTNFFLQSDRSPYILYYFFQVLQKLVVCKFFCFQNLRELLTHKLLGFLHLPPKNRCPEIHSLGINRLPIESKKPVGLSSCQIETRAFENFFNGVFEYFRLNTHASSLNHLMVMV